MERGSPPPVIDSGGKLGRCGGAVLPLSPFGVCWGCRVTPDLIASLNDAVRSTPAPVLCLMPHQSPFRLFHLVFETDRLFCVPFGSV